MKPKVASILLAVILPGLARAQEAPKMEFSIDGSYVHYQAIDFESPKQQFGRYWDLGGGGGAFVRNFGSKIGIRADLQGYTSNTKTVSIPSGSLLLPQGGSVNASGNLFTYMGGLQVGQRSGRWRPYAVGLAGGAHSNVYKNLFTGLNLTGSKAPDNNAFAADAGLGLDVALTPRVDFRPFEMSYLYTRFQGTGLNFTNNQNNWRYLGGININI